MTNKLGRFREITLKGISAVVLASFLLFSNCNKQPTADFVSDSDKYLGGDIIKLTNKSVNAKSYKWTLSDGQTSTAENIDFTLPDNALSGLYSIKLEAFSNRNRKTSEIVKTVSVTAATGKGIFWTSSKSFDSTLILINNLYGATVKLKQFISNPGCNPSYLGCFIIISPVGVLTFTAISGQNTRTGTLNITKNGCSDFELK
jgi:hypothetical protein